MNLTLPIARISSNNKVKLGSITINVAEKSTNSKGSVQALNNLEQAIKDGVFSSNSEDMVPTQEQKNEGQTS